MEFKIETPFRRWRIAATREDQKKKKDHQRIALIVYQMRLSFRDHYSIKNFMQAFWAQA